MLTTSINEGQFVHHIKRPQWGPGFVQRVSHNYIHIVFEHEGFKRIGRQFERDVLTQIQGTTLPDHSRVATAEGRKAILAPPAVRRVSKSLQRLGELAVFNRNHTPYMEQTLAIHADNPEREVTFRAATRWVSVEKAVSAGMNPTIYIAEVDGDSEVRYEARLGRVLIDPESDRELANELNELSLESTRNEGLWNGQVQTLYTITHLRRLERPFSMTELVKLNGGEVIDANYTRAYCLVRRQRKEMSDS